jgi:amino-acid N-acetyltransferase
MSPAIEPARRADADDILELVVQNGLPPDALRDHLATALVAREAGRIVGTAALELYPDGALLRSVAVAPHRQGKGLGRELTAAAVHLAQQRGAPAMYLLTTTAEGFFRRFGFERIARADVPASVQTSIEFTFVCPSSAAVMCKSFDVNAT